MQTALNALCSSHKLLCTALLHTHMYSV